MPAYREIRADYDRYTIVVYQAYNDAIADAALRALRAAVFDGPHDVDQAVVPVDDGTRRLGLT